MKNRKKIVGCIVLLSLLCIILIIVMSVLLKNNTKWNLWNLGSSTKVSHELVIDETYYDDFNEININSIESNIAIKQSSDNTFQVLVYGDKETNNVDLNNDTLQITNTTQSSGISINHTIAKIEVYIPDDYDKNIIIQNDYGDVDIDDFMNATVTVEINFGDVNIGNIKVANIINNCGDITINNVLEYMKLEDDCGDITINNVQITQDSLINIDLGDVIIGSTNEIYIDASTDLGDVNINNNYHLSDITLTIKNDCGDIEVNN